MQTSVKHVKMFFFNFLTVINAYLFGYIKLELWSFDMQNVCCSYVFMTRHIICVNVHFSKHAEVTISLTNLYIYYININFIPVY